LLGLAWFILYGLLGRENKMFFIVNDALAYNELNSLISFDLGIFLCSFLALFVLSSFILLEVKRIRRYIKKRGEK